MTGTFRPDNTEQLRDAVAWAISEAAPLEVFGSGSKAGIGRAMQTESGIDLSAMTGITLYEPEELVLSARAGTPLSEIEAALAANNQELAFEPPDMSVLLGSTGSGTIGGVIASNLAGPRRLKSGAARDHFLGFTAITGRGDLVRSGSRVVKNVTGYDLPKLIAGSWGTLAAMSDVTVKVLPAAESQATLALCGLTAAAAVEAMSIAMQSSCEVSAAAHCPADVTALSSVPSVRSAGTSLTLLRLEGIEPSVEFRFGKLKDLLAGKADLIRLEAADSASIWHDIRNVNFFPHDEARIVWRVSVPPAEGAAVAKAIGAIDGVRCFLDWAGGLVWADMPVSDHGHAQVVRGAFAGTTGHATLIRAPQALRAAIPVFEPQVRPLAELTARVKASFDPSGILNPGRMYA